MSKLFATETRTARNYFEIFRIIPCLHGIKPRRDLPIGRHEILILIFNSLCHPRMSKLNATETRNTRKKFNINSVPSVPPWLFSIYGELARNLK
jgi:hypothetical protein